MNTYDKNQPGIALTAEIAAELKENNPINAFFHKSDLLEILELTDCIGIRFYPMLSAHNEYTILSIGVREDRTGIKIGQEFIRAEKNNEITKLDPDQAAEEIVRTIEHLKAAETVSPFLRNMEEVTENSPFLFAVYFSESVLSQMLSNSEVIGLRFYLDTLQVGLTQHDTLTAISVGMDGRDNANLSAYLRSAAPCPPDCGNQGSYTPKL